MVNFSSRMLWDTRTMNLIMPLMAMQPVTLVGPLLTIFDRDVLAAVVPSHREAIPTVRHADLPIMGSY